jgi:DnaJ-class molecular chaperone
MNKSSPNTGNATEAGQRNPGDEAVPGSFQTGEATCPECHGSGKKEGQTVCANCGGTGKIVKIVGDA